MPRAAKKTTVPRKRSKRAEKVRDAIAELIEGAEETTPDPIADLLEQFSGSSYRLKIERLSLPPRRIWEYIGFFGLTENLQEDVRKFAGGGEYKGQLHGPNGYEKGHAISFEIAGPPKAIRAADDEPAKPAAVVNDDDAHMRRIERTVNMITGIAAAIGLAPILQKLVEPKAGGVDIATMMKLTSDAETKGRELGERLGKLEATGAPDRRDPMLQLADKYADPILKLMLTDKSKATPTQPAADASAPKQIAAAPLPAGYEWLEGLRPHYNVLLDYAEKDLDADWIATGTLRQADDELLAAMRIASQRGDFRDVMRKELQAIETLDAEWLEEYLSTIIAELANKPGKPRKS